MVPSLQTGTRGVFLEAPCTKIQMFKSRDLGSNLKRVSALGGGGREGSWQGSGSSAHGQDLGAHGTSRAEGSRVSLTGSTAPGIPRQGGPQDPAGCV